MNFKYYFKLVLLSSPFGLLFAAACIVLGFINQVLVDYSTPAAWFFFGLLVLAWATMSPFFVAAKSDGGVGSVFKLFPRDMIARKSFKLTGLAFLIGTVMLVGWIALLWAFCIAFTPFTLAPGVHY